MTIDLVNAIFFLVAIFISDAVFNGEIGLKAKANADHKIGCAKGFHLDTCSEIL